MTSMYCIWIFFRIVYRESVYHRKTTGIPSYYKNVPIKKLHNLKNDKYVSQMF